ncbi:MAG: DNA primase [Hylemonella sp.]
MAIPASFIQELLARADVVDIVGRYVQLKKSGANFMGLCPFHAEKSPSFSVSPTKQFYHCFGCGKHGDAIRFLMEHTGMGFVEAVQDLAQQYGMQVPDDAASPQDRARAAEQRQRHATLTEVLEKAAAAYRQHLKASARAIDYLKGRGLTGAIARRYGLGYAPPGWRTLASVFADYNDPLLVEAGLVIAGGSEGEADAEGKRYDRFRDRIMFPIRNVKGECIGFGGRVLGDEKPKYLNSPETPVFSKGQELYGLYEARHAIRDAGYVLVTEGYMDVVALAQLGFANAVATLGTACTADHVHKLFRHTDTVVFSFDGDAAGRRAARRALEAALPYASDLRTVKFLFLPPEHDPDSYIRQHGPQAFAHCVSEAVPLSRFLIDSAREGCELGTAEGRAQFTSHARPLWVALPDGALKHQLLAEIAAVAQLPAAELQALWGPSPHSAAPPRRASATGYAEPTRRPGAPATRTGSRRQPWSRADHATRLLLGHSLLWEQLSADEQALLCGLPQPHGTLLAWLEAQLHEHGPQPWAALRVALQEHPDAAVAERLMHGSELPLPETRDEALAELRNLLRRMLIDQLKAEETAALAAAPTDPQAQLRYRELQARRRALENHPG